MDGLKWRDERGRGGRGEKFPVGPYIVHAHDHIGAGRSGTDGQAVGQVCCAFVNSLARSLAFSLPPAAFLPRSLALAFGLEGGELGVVGVPLSS